MNKKYIFITGGVVSSLGKGILTASLGALLEAHNLKLLLMKLDPYINIDPGTMSPFQHGEVFVTYDGAETDLDLGHYERFVRFKATKTNNFTAGQVYQSVIENERQGQYLGSTVQIIPHVTDEIKRRIQITSEDCDILLVEIGGTVGDIESLPFLEAIRQIGIELGPKNVSYIHLTLLPYLKTSNEIKTKPTQHSVKELRSIGIQPNILVCRTEKSITKADKDKIALFTNVHSDSVIVVPDVSDTHEIPIILQKEGLDEILLEQFKIQHKPVILHDWEHVLSLQTKSKQCSLFERNGHSNYVC
jgi:CTP synthase